MGWPKGPTRNDEMKRRTKQTRVAFNRERAEREHINTENHIKHSAGFGQIRMYNFWNTIKTTPFAFNMHIISITYQFCVRWALSQSTECWANGKLRRFLSKRSRYGCAIPRHMERIRKDVHRKSSKTRTATIACMFTRCEAFEQQKNPFTVRAWLIVRWDESPPSCGPRWSIGEAQKHHQHTLCQRVSGEHNVPRRRQPARANTHATRTTVPYAWHVFPFYFPVYYQIFKWLTIFYLAVAVDLLSYLCR